MKRWLGYENILNPSKTRSLCSMNTVKILTAEWFDQVAGTGFQKGVQKIVFLFCVFSQIIILENANLRMAVCVIAN